MTNTDLSSTDPATLVFETSVGFTSIKVTCLTVTVRPYAQFAQALEIRYIERGKRRFRGVILTDSHAWVVLAGHVDVFNDGHGAAVSYAPLHSADMESAIRATGAHVLRDYRTHNTRGV